ncbi:MAG TPA: hypothetical protein VJO12_16615 [Stellaceae bacterium]|nr:hypothetical protein [Stellaceae bacterium]
MRLPLLFRLLLLAPLAACAVAPPLEAVRATPDEVTFAYGDGRAADAARQAALYCANLGRLARPRQVTRDGDRSIARFACE